MSKYVPSEASRERAKARKREKYALNRERLQREARERRATPEGRRKAREAFARWRQKHPEKDRYYTHLSHARRGTTPFQRYKFLLLTDTTFAELEAQRKAIHKLVGAKCPDLWKNWPMTVATAEERAEYARQCTWIGEKE